MSSRLLILALTAVAVVIGGVNLSLTAPDAVRAVHNQIDGQLGRVARALPGALDGAAERSLGLVTEVAGNEGVQTALAGATAAPDQALLDRMLQAADASAEKHGERDVRKLAVVATGTGAAVFRHGQDVQFAADAGVPLVKEALGGARGTAVAKVGDAIFRVAAAPIGTQKTVGAVALGFPVDDAFAAGLRDTVGADVTVLQDGKILATSLGAEERGLLAAAAAGASAGTPFGFGEMPEETFSLFGLVKLPLFGGEATPVRAQSVRVPGLEGAEVIVSAPAVAALVPVADAQKTNILLSGVILVVGLLFTGLARNKGSYEEEDVAGLADVVERAAGGDAGARAAEFLPGDLGRLARAVNKLAVKVRQPAAAAHAAAPASEAVPPAEATGEFADRFPFGDAAPAHAAASEATVIAAPPREPTPGPAALAPEPTPAPAMLADPTPGPAYLQPEPPAPAHAPRETTAGPAYGMAAMADEPAPARPQPDLGWSSPGALAMPAATRPENDFSGLLGDESAGTPGPGAYDTFTQALREAGKHQEQQQHPAILNPDATIVAAVPEALLRATSRAPAPAPRQAEPTVIADPDELHFQQVFQEFLETRERCNESVGALTYEKFAVKLRKNREQLVAKYQCRTVRFTVYVKDGKAALKAAPVRD